MANPAFYDLTHPTVFYNSFKQAFGMIARHISGCLVYCRIDREGNPQSPLQYIEGRLPVKSEQKDIDINQGGIGDGIYIGGLPFNPATLAYLDARTSPANYEHRMSRITLDASDAPPIAKYNNGLAINGTTLSDFIPSSMGVSVAEGHTGVVVTSSGEMIVFFSYAPHFTTKTTQAECSPFIGRVYAMMSNSDGSVWTPPVCVLNLSPFNPPGSLFKSSFEGMLAKCDATYNIFTQNSVKRTFDTDTAGIRDASYLNDSNITRIAIEDMTAYYSHHNKEVYLSFWFDGFILMAKIPPASIEILSKMVTAISAPNNDATSKPLPPYKLSTYRGIYDAKDSNGEFTYSRYFWLPQADPELFVIAGPTDSIIERSEINPPLPKPKTENIGFTILKSYKGDLRNKTINASDGKTYNANYHSVLQATQPPGIQIKFGNREFADYQRKQKPGVNEHTRGFPVVIFYSSDKDIAYFPMSPSNTTYSEDFPKVAGTI